MEIRLAESVIKLKNPAKIELIVKRVYGLASRTSIG